MSQYILGLALAAALILAYMIVSARPTSTPQGDYLARQTVTAYSDPRNLPIQGQQPYNQRSVQVQTPPMCADCQPGTANVSQP